MLEVSLFASLQNKELQKFENRAEHNVKKLRKNSSDL